MTKRIATIITITCISTFLACSTAQEPEDLYERHLATIYSTENILDLDSFLSSSSIEKQRKYLKKLADKTSKPESKIVEQLLAHSEFRRKYYERCLTDSKIVKKEKSNDTARITYLVKDKCEMKKISEGHYEGKKIIVTTSMIDEIDFVFENGWKLAGEKSTADESVEFKPDLTPKVK